MNQIYCKRQLTLLSLLLCFAVPSLRAGFVETFEDGTNDGDWRLTTSTEPVIEADGGNPGAYLRQHVDAYYVGTDISHFPPGWQTYSFRIDAASPVIPPGWVVTRGNGRPGTDADWQALMRDVETVGLELGTPGYFYPFWIWD